MNVEEKDRERVGMVIMTLSRVVAWSGVWSGDISGPPPQIGPSLLDRDPDALLNDAILFISNFEETEYVCIIL